MNKQELKAHICSAIDMSAEKIIGLAKNIWQEAEPGYEEHKTAAKVENIFRMLGLPVETKLANTGVKAVFDSGKCGPNVAVLGELDALVMPNHPEANPETDAAHACGHNMQIAALCGVATADTPCTLASHNPTGVACAAPRSTPLPSQKKGLPLRVRIPPSTPHVNESRTGTGWTFCGSAKAAFILKFGTGSGTPYERSADAITRLISIIRRPQVQNQITI